MSSFVTAGVIIAIFAFWILLGMGIAWLLVGWAQRRAFENYAYFDHAVFAEMTTEEAIEYARGLLDGHTRKPPQEWGMLIALIRAAEITVEGVPYRDLNI